VVLDGRGKDLLDLCISHQLRLLNGRVFGDCFGKNTCYTPNGTSVVDYVMASVYVLMIMIYCSFMLIVLIPSFMIVIA
jgi:hypothetical protein